MNIFVRELVALLANHGKELGSLYGLHSPTHRLLPSKVTRLKRSLTTNITATLNAADLDLVVQWLKLDPNGEEIRRLRAALLAEVIRHLLGGRMNVDVADELGEVAFQVLISKTPKRFLAQRAELLSGVRHFDASFLQQPLRSENVGDILRGGLVIEQETEVTSWNLTDKESEEMGLTSSPLEPALEEAIETYEQGVLWLEVARDASYPATRQSYLVQARALLHQAQHLAADAVIPAPNREQEQEWRSAIRGATQDFPELDG